MSIRLLHISDIHFKHYNDDTKVFDLESDVRAILEQDLSRLIKESGSINAILLGGDIAFSGKAEEYQTADQWISRLCELTNCPSELVFPVPGNHDIDRDSITAIVGDTQEEVKSLTTRLEINKKLERLLTDKHMLATIKAPLGNYEYFAQKYGGSLTENKGLFWEKELRDENSLTLKVRGINSALFSNKGDNPIEKKLVIGTAQCIMLSENTKVNMFLCHHPPEWLVDGDQIKHEMCQRANLLLFGHVHTLATEQIEETLLISAGALQPERNDPNWTPAYNIIEVTLYPTGHPILCVANMPNNFVSKRAHAKISSEADV